MRRFAFGPQHALVSRMGEPPPRAETTHVLVCVLSFSDGGLEEAQELHRGDEESCQKAGRLLPAVAYQGPRPATQALMRILTNAEWATAQGLS